MIEVKIPKEIQEYKSKLIFGLSTRQFISVAITVAIGVFMAMCVKKYVPDDIFAWLTILAISPVVGYGFFTFKDMKFEEFVKMYFNLTFLPQKRTYEDIDMNIFHSLNEEIIVEEILNERFENGEIEGDWNC